jgi:hypothetical protein
MNFQIGDLIVEQNNIPGLIVGLKDVGPRGTVRIKWDGKYYTTPYDRKFVRIQVATMFWKHYPVKPQLRSE